MSGRRLQFGVAVLDGRLYVVGGRDGLKTLNTVECYNPHSKTWSVMPPMSTHRHGLGEPRERGRRHRDPFQLWLISQLFLNRF